MNNSEILKIALEQSAYDCNCEPGDFLKNENVITLSKENPKARIYVPLPLECDLITYGSNIVAQVSERVQDSVKRFLDIADGYHTFETPFIYLLDDYLEKYGLKVCFMAEYFLPDLDHFKIMECDYKLKILKKLRLDDYYLPQWGNALYSARKEYDMLAVGAFDGDHLIGLAGASADCEMMWQIGVDVLPEYRKRGVAASVTSHLAAEVLKLGKVPFYCAAWSNIKSVRNALKCGFKPAWAELTARDAEFVNKLNSRSNT